MNKIIKYPFRKYIDRYRKQDEVIRIVKAIQELVRNNPDDKAGRDKLMEELEQWID